MFWLPRLATLAVAYASHVALECDDLAWANATKHVPSPAANFTHLLAYSWHIHYTWMTEDQHENVVAFEQAFCTEFARLSKDTSRMPECGWGPNYLGDDEEFMCSHTGQCDEAFNNKRQFPPQCGNGTCFSAANGPWSVCQSEFFVPARHIDEVTVWLTEPQNTHGLVVMRHPNTGCQWGDHLIRAEFFSDEVPEMCLWGVPCNTPGFGCRTGMCGDFDGSKHIHQHASGCYNETGNHNVMPIMI